MRRRIALILAAVVLAGVGTFGLYSYVSKADSRALEGKETVDVLVASSKIASGTSASDIDAEALVTTETFAKDSVPDDSIGDIDEIEDLYSVTDIPANQALRRGLFSDHKPEIAADLQTEKTAGVAVPKGQVALPVSFKSYVKGEDWYNFVRPGANVAIFLTYIPIDPVTGKKVPVSKDEVKGEDDKSFAKATTLLVKEALVLGAGDNVTPSTDSKPTMTNAPALLLAVDQSEAERLILAMSAIPEGSALYPVLLTKDSKIEVTPGTDTHHIFDGVGEEPQP